MTPYLIKIIREQDSKYPYLSPEDELSAVNGMEYENAVQFLVNHNLVSGLKVFDKYKWRFDGEGDALFGLVGEILTSMARKYVILSPKPEERFLLWAACYLDDEIKKQAKTDVLDSFWKYVHFDGLSMVNKEGKEQGSAESFLNSFMDPVTSSEISKENHVSQKIIDEIKNAESILTKGEKELFELVYFKYNSIADIAKAAKTDATTVEIALGHIIDKVRKQLHINEVCI